MGKYEETICELYDNNPSTYQIRSISKMYGIDPEEVERILTDNGRELPKPGRPKASIKKNDPPKDPVETEKDSDGAVSEEVNEKENAKNIPEAVKSLVFNRIDYLEGELSDLNKRIAKLEDAKTALTSEYKVLADYISMPFGAGNLSHESSDNMVESPQADA